VWTPLESDEGAGPVADEVELMIVAGTFDARTGREAELAAVLAKYVVLTRGAPACRNVDLVGSVTRPGRFLVVEKWADPLAQRAHLDSPEMVEMAEAATSLLAGAPDLDLYTAISAHDLT
jgi:quinol monooxygenase YgiN